MKLGDLVKAIPNDSWGFTENEIESHTQTGILLGVEKDTRYPPAKVVNYYKIHLDEDCGIFHGGDYNIEVLNEL